VLVFPGQHLAEDQQVAFAKRFGEIELLAPDPEQKAVAISNQKPDGTVFAADEHRFKSLRGNEGWHTDSSYMPLAAKASVLSAQVVPAAAGETEWADMRAAYDALDEATRRRIAGLSAHHSLYHSQARIGHVVETGAGYGFHTKGAPRRPLVKVHPVTGRPALFIGRHAYGIPGLDPAESGSCARPGRLRACRPPRTYAHRWQPGDVVIWDNRCVLHRARPYDYREPRVMRHTRVAGDPATEWPRRSATSGRGAYEAVQRKPIAS
jgi:alpha-ketoglutarate-dependent taurine dioxygenase